MGRDKDDLHSLARVALGHRAAPRSRDLSGSQGAKGGGVSGVRLHRRKRAMGEAPGFAYRALDQARGRGLVQS